MLFKTKIIHCGLQPNYASGSLAKAPCFSLITPLTLVNGNDLTTLL
jgi:hypothetical protein